MVDFILVWLGGAFGATAGTLLVASSDAQTVFLAGLVGQYVGFLGVMAILARFKTEAGLGLVIQGSDFFYVAGGLTLQFAVALLLSPLADALFENGLPTQTVADSLVDASSIRVQVTLVFLYVVVGPVVEELTYRGVLFKALRRRGKWVAILGTAIVFAFVHYEVGSGWQTAVVILPPVFVLGALLAWLTERNGRLGPAIFLHSGWNLLAAFVLLLPPELLEQVS